MRSLSPMGQRWWRTFQSTGAATIVHVDLTPYAVRVEQAEVALDRTEKGRLSRYRLPRPRHEFALCRAALRAVLCLRLGCRNDDLAFEASPHGKPAAVVGGRPAAICFNVSHSGNHGLIALAEQGRIGVDVEERRSRPDPDGPIRTVFCPAEQAELAAARGAHKTELFFTLWTMKEALIKALGVGLSLDTSTFEVPHSMRRGARTGILRFPHDPTVGWRLDNLGNADFAAAVAHELDPGA